MKRRVLALCASLLILSFAPGLTLAAAAPVVDQSSLGSDRVWLLSGTFAQTFKVGKTGALSGVDLWMFIRTGTTTVTVTIEKQTGVPGHPDGTHLVQKAVAVGTADGWVHFALKPLNVSSGQALAIVFSLSSSCSVRGSVSNKYQGGAAENAKYAWNYVQGSSRADFAFRSYMGPTVAASPTAKPKATATPTPTPTPTLSPTLVPTPTPTPTSGPTAVPKSGSGSGGSSGSPLPIVPALLVALTLLIGGLWFFFDRRRRQLKGRYPPRR